ncbi:MAG: PEP-CTERM sorting domain-containing protein [Planctomycetota bacterium]|jgi:hypothetical protein
MKMGRAILLVGFAIASTASANLLFQAGGDRLVQLQNIDGGWDAPLDDLDPTSGSSTKAIGPTAMGLAQAYRQTLDPVQLAALQSAGGFLLSKTDTFSPADGYLAVELDSIFAVTTYTDHIRDNFYDALSAGTYNRNGAGILYDTAAYINLIRSERSGAIANLAAWDLGTALYSAELIGEDTSLWIAGTKAEIEELDGDKWYDVLGLAGSILGLASVAEDFDPQAGEHADATSLTDLCEILAGYQIDGGGFAWNSGYLFSGGGNETVQETAYAILAMAALDAAAYAPSIDGAQSYLQTVQLPTGGWENHFADGENNQTTGEALWAIPEPTALALLAIGAAAVLRRQRP